MENLKNQTNFIQFEPAQLFCGSIWYVQYKIVNPKNGQLERKRIKINRIVNLRERKIYGQELVKVINKKLYNGWNPFVENEAPKGFVKIVEATNIYLRNKKRELRADSMRSYNSFVKNFKEWLLVNDQYTVYCANFSADDARQYLNDIYNLQKLSARTFNNYKKFMIGLFNWMLEERYVKVNPFLGIKNKKQVAKKRIIVSEENREIIKNYLKENDMPFFIITQLVYFTLIRPKEICHLKPNNFNLTNQTLFVPGVVAKNGKDRLVTIPNAFMADLIAFRFNNAAPDQLIFGEDFLPNKKVMSSRRLSRKWSNMRKVLGLPMEVQLYSLRDTGIIEMLQSGVSPEEVMKQADHSSLEMTSVYAKHANPEGSYQIRNRLKDF